MGSNLYSDVTDSLCCDLRESDLHPAHRRTRALRGSAHCWRAAMDAVRQSNYNDVGCTSDKYLGETVAARLHALHRRAVARCGVSTVRALPACVAAAAHPLARAPGQPLSLPCFPAVSDGVRAKGAQPCGSHRQQARSLPLAEDAPGASHQHA
eukprot:3565698-Pleurochrysis_carterae.AAC.2